MPTPTDDPRTPAPELTILVVRTGGVTGMTRRWRVEPASDDADRWIGLVDRCPWDEDAETGSGADRFVWRIDVRSQQRQHERVIPEAHLTGPWRDLVEAVRSAGSA